MLVRGRICQRRPTDITSGNYRGEMNSEKFIGLLRGKLIPNLPPKSVVVIDKASYHSVQEDKCPTQASRKADMQARLTKHNVAWSNDMLKVELLELCRTHRPLPTYVVDETLTSWKHLRTKLTPDFHLTYRKNGGNLGSE